MRGSSVRRALKERRERQVKFNKSPIALAALALCGALPISAHAAPTVSWVTPTANATVRGTISGSACAVRSCCKKATLVAALLVDASGMTATLPVSRQTAE